METGRISASVEGTTPGTLTSRGNGDVHTTMTPETDSRYAGAVHPVGEARGAAPALDAPIDVVGARSRQPGG